jgi:acyl-CoA synthetase (AMP-forming)/AMP-acid ligase II
MLYTGGTTGMPKGVMKRMGDFTVGMAAVLGPGVRGITPPATGAAPLNLVGLAVKLRPARLRPPTGA